MKKIIFLTLGVIIVAGMVYFVWFRGKDSPYDFIVAERGDVVQQVSVTGRVVPSENVNLAFEKAGKVSAIFVDVGTNVYNGQLLAQLNTSEIQAQVESAEAALKVEEAELNELKIGTRPEQVQVFEVKVKNTEIALADAKQNFLDKIQDAYTKSDDAVRGKVDQLFDAPRSSDPRLVFSSSDYKFDSEVEKDRFLIESLLISWFNRLSGLTVNSDLLSCSSATKNNLNEVKAFLEKIAYLVNSLNSSSVLSQTTIDGWKTDISAARTNLNTAIVNLTTAEEKFRAADSDLALKKQELELEKAGSTAEDIAAQEARVEKAKADLQQYRAQLSKHFIYSPVNGIVTKKDVSEGEAVAANTAFFSVISGANFEIEANVPEADIGKVKIGDATRVTLDTYGNDVFFDAVVSFIEPAEKIIEGVATYKTTLQFLKADERIKSGMTTNIDILTAERKNAIIVPQRSILQKNGNKFVRILSENGESFEERIVKIGLKGSDGNAEILEGLSRGEKVVTFVKEK